MTCDSRTPVAQSDFVIAPKGSALSVPGLLVEPRESSLGPQELPQVPVPCHAENSRGQLLGVPLPHP